MSNTGESLLSRATSALLHAGLIALGLMTALVVGQVICRNAFDLGLPWADELARFCGVALVFLAAPYLLFKGAHIAVDLVPNLLPEGPRAVLARINGILMLLFCGIMLYGLYKFLLRAGKFSTPALEIPNWVYYLPAVLGIALFALVALYRLFVAAPLSEDGPKA